MLSNFCSVMAWLGIAATITGRAHGCQSGSGICTDAIIGTAVDSYTDGNTNSLPPIEDWDVSEVTDMSDLFRGESGFTGDLSRWNVGSVTTMAYTFAEATSFNGDLTSWNVGSVTTMDSMFGQATSFNGDLTGWNVGSVTTMAYMFAGATSFNVDLTGWNVGAVTAGTGNLRMFLAATSFDEECSPFYVLGGGTLPCLAPVPVPPTAWSVTVPNTALEIICQTTILVEYIFPAAGLTLGPIVLGRGQNGAVISLFPGTFKATAEMRVCDENGQLLPRVAFFGETTVDYTASTGEPRTIVQYAIDTQFPINFDPYEQNFAPLITSIEITPQMVSIGDTATITATGYEINGGADFVRTMELEVFDASGSSRRARRAADHTLLRNMTEATTDREQTTSFDFTPTLADFAGSSASAHSLIGRVTATDDFNLTGSAEIPFSVNRLDRVEIGAVAFTRPRVSLNQLNQNHSTVYSVGQAVVKLDVFDPDVANPPVLENNYTYEENHTYRIEFGNADVAGSAVNTVASPTCKHAYGRDNCFYTACTCTRSVDAAGNQGCDEIEVSDIPGENGGEWTFVWDPWVDQNVLESAAFGTTYCQLRVHFVDNTASLSTAGHVISEGLRTNNVSILLEASPGSTESNQPPSIGFFYAAHLELDLTDASSSSIRTTVTVAFEDPGSSRPNTVLGYANGNTCAVKDCFQRFDVDDSAATVVRTTDVSAGVWQDVWSINGTVAVTALSSVRAYLKLVDAFTGHISYHHVATITDQAARRHRRDTPAAAPQVAAMTLTIDANGELSGDMAFPSGVVDGDGDGDGDGDTVFIQVDGAVTSVPDVDRDEKSGGDTDDRQLVVLVVLVCGVGFFCVLVVAICLACAVSRRGGTARTGPNSKTSSEDLTVPSTILVPEFHLVDAISPGIMEVGSELHV